MYLAPHTDKKGESMGYAINWFAIPVRSFKRAWKFSTTILDAVLGTQTILLLQLSLCSFTFLPAQGQKPTIENLAWISGCWERNGGNRQTVEQWMKPAGGTMLGMSRTVASGRTVEYEHLLLHQIGDTIYYVATPSRQQRASFKLVHSSSQEAVFENPEHDFPQRIIYRLQADGSLVARIEGKSKGVERGIDFPFKKSACD